MINFVPEIDGIYMFCRYCGTYRRFIFERPIPWKKDVKISGKCDRCNFSQILNVAQARTYYEHLNEDNK